MFPPGGGPALAARRQPATVQTALLVAVAVVYAGLILAVERAWRRFPEKR